MSPEPGLVLYDYWRSSAAYRVRIALRLKGLKYEQRAVNLIRDGGEQHGAAYRALNPQGLVPALVHDGRILTQSLAICEYLEEVFPETPLLPAGVEERARARALALMIACDIHPLNNLRVQQHLRRALDADDRDLEAWMNHWMSTGFAAVEAQLTGGRFCSGETPGLADCFLVPQVYNAERYGCDLTPFPGIREISTRCRALPAFAGSAPEAQPDAPSG